jgi:uncharacterized protein
MSTPLTLTQRLAPTATPKRILALDGGGLRGVLTLGMLRQIETLLRERHGRDGNFRLCDYFDLIAGTSTGAIIASGLALGMSVDEVHQHYLRLGEYVFKRTLLSWLPTRPRFPAAKVSAALKQVFGERCMDSADFRTGLLVVTKRLDTGSVWPLTNNPKTPYFDRGENATTIANREYPLWQVVRASTAAPYYFDFETINIGRGSDGVKAVRGDFIDGGASPHNNPSLQALMTATMPGFGFGWAAGADRLLVVSVGTGKANEAMGHATLLKSTAEAHALRSLTSLMGDCGELVETMMQWLSNSPTARKIDRVMGTTGTPLGGTPLCSYLRFNVHFDREWYEMHMGESANAEKLKALEAMDEPANINELDRIGRLAGERLVRTEHFAPAFDLS